MNQLQVDDLDFEVRYSSRRKTMEITVDRGGQLVIAAPAGTDASRLREFVREKRFWIYRKLTEKSLLRKPIPRKEFVDGEGFLYLGRSYRLKLVDDQEEPLKLVNGRFRLRRDLASDGRNQFIAWYSRHARDWLAGKVREYSARMEVGPSGVRVQDLGYRWGSCGKGDLLYFHWKTILLPRPIAEYVAVHELAHLHVPHHTPAFWKRLERVFPDYERRRVWLAEHGMSTEIL